MLKRSRWSLILCVCLVGVSATKTTAAETQTSSEAKNANTIQAISSEEQRLPLERGLTTLREDERLPKNGSKPGEEWNQNALGMVFCWCPSGKFLMGSPENESQRFEEEAQVQVTITQGFWLGKYEVTQTEYKALMGQNPSQFAAGAGYQRRVAGLDTSHFPVDHVSWEDAMTFCRKLTERERQAGTLPADWEYTLPSEAQWEYACRSGTKTATAFGEKLSSQHANFDGRSPYRTGIPGAYLKRPTEVGSYPASGWGLCDMHGNVFEWCRNRGYQETLPGKSDPEVDEQSWARILRGGGWRNAGRECRSARRTMMPPMVRDSMIGFRVVAMPVRQGDASKRPND